VIPLDDVFFDALHHKHDNDHQQQDSHGHEVKHVAPIGRDADSAPLDSRKHAQTALVVNCVVDD
jgi:hypothetical protein